MGSGEGSILRPQHPSARHLSALVDEFGLETRGSLDDVEVTGITLSTDNLQPGDLYVGVPGANRHGAMFAAQAKEVERLLCSPMRPGLTTPPTAGCR